MKARALKFFHDAEEGVNRRPGDEFECTAKRLAAINSTGAGELAEKVASRKGKAAAGAAAADAAAADAAAADGEEA